MKKITLTFLMAMVTIATKAATFTQGNFTYQELTDSTASVTGLSSTGSSATSLQIFGYTFNPNNQKYYRVTEIKSEAFRDNAKITEVRIGPGVETINGYAFNSCTNLKTVSLPSTIKKIGAYVFHKCPITLINCAAETMPTFDANTFYGLGTVSGTRNWWEGTKAGFDAATANNTITSIFSVGMNAPTAYDVACYVGSDYRCYVYAIVTNPWSPVSQRGGKCKIIYASPHSKNTSGILQIPYNTTLTETSYDRYEPVEIADYAFQSTSKIRILDLSETSSFKKIGICAFKDCKSLISVTLSAKTIGNFAFQNCTNLSSVKLYGENEDYYCVEALGCECFRNTDVTSVYIPKGLTTYEAGAFDFCPKLTTFTVNSSNPAFAAYDYSLYSKDYATLYQYPSGVSAVYFGEKAHVSLRSIYTYAFRGNSKTSSLTVPYGVRIINGEAFGHMSALQKLVIPSSVSIYMWNAFQNLPALKDFYFNINTVPSDLKQPNAFYGLASGCKLHIPKACTANYSSTSPWSTVFTGGIVEDSYDYLRTYTNGSSLDYYLAYTVTSTESYTDTKVQSTAVDGQMRLVWGQTAVEGGFNGTITIPKTITLRNKTYMVTEVGREAFRNQTLIKKVTGGEGIKKIGALSFAGLTGCSNGFEIPNPVEFCDSALFNCWTPTIKLGDRLTTIGKDAFRQSAVTKVIMPASVTSIGSRFVAGVHQLDSLKLSPNITEIPDQGLGWCSARWLVIPYGVKKIGSQAFFSDNNGSGLDEPVRENVVVIPSSVTSMASDAFAGARHLDVIFLNLPYGKFTTTKSDWKRRVEQATNTYDWSGHKLYVPAGQIEQYRNDPGIRQCWSIVDIQAGAFDFTTGNDFWNTMYRMTVVNAKTKTAKYVYNWGHNSNTINIKNTETDHNNGIDYTMVEIGDSCWVNRPDVNIISIPSNSAITRIGAFAFKDCTGLTGEISLPESVAEIGQYAFWNCKGVTSLFLNCTNKTTIADYAWNSTSSYNTDNIKLYVPISQYWNILGQTQDWLPYKFTYNCLLPYIKPTSEWSVVSVPTDDAILLPTSGEFYIANSFNQDTQIIGRKKLNNDEGIKGFEGMLFKGTPGTVYRFRQIEDIINTSYIFPSVNYLKGPHPDSFDSDYEEKVAGNTISYYRFIDDNDPVYNSVCFVRTDKYHYNVGSAYLQLQKEEGSPAIIYPSDVPNVRGDVNDDGQVGSDDIVAITNVIAGIETNPYIKGRADVNGDGRVDISDIVAITKIILASKVQQ